MSIHKLLIYLFSTFRGGKALTLLVAGSWLSLLVAGGLFRTPP